MGEERTDSSVMSGCRRCAYGLRLPLRRSLTATSAPMCSGRAAAPDVGADVRGEVPARAREQRHAERRRDRQRPHGVGLGLLLERDRQHPAVHAGLDQAGRDDPGRPADRAGRVHPQQRLAGGAERVGQVQLGHHHALEQVGRLADHDRVDVRQRRPASASARSTASRHSPAIDTSVRRVRCWVWPTPRTAARCRVTAGPPSRRRGSAAGRGRWWRGRAPGRPGRTKISRAAIPIRARPAANIGLPHSAPPDGLTRTPSPRPSAAAQQDLLVGERRVQLGDVDAGRAGRAARRRRPTARWSGRARPATASRSGARTR